MKILALIPARSGSKGIAYKNIRLFGGKPLLAYSIEQAKSSSLINRVIVSTDSSHYAEIARQHGAETPFLRPAEISQDYSTDLELFQHALNWLEKNENYVPEFCVHLRPTYPIRRVEDVDAIIKILLENPEVDAVRSVVPAPVTPCKMWFRDEDGCLSPVVKTEIQDAHSLPRQVLPQVFIQNACIDSIRSRVITKENSMTGKKIYGYVMEKSYDIDTEEEFQQALAEISADRRGSVQGYSPAGRRTFCIDIDGVVASIVKDNQYDLSSPISRTISAINALFEKGHYIILFTARGTVTGIDWRKTTEKQMNKWGVKYHELIFGKPAADYYVDDRALSPEEFYALASEVQATSKTKGDGDDEKPV